MQEKKEFALEVGGLEALIERCEDWIIVLARGNHFQQELGEKGRIPNSKPNVKVYDLYLDDFIQEAEMREFYGDEFEAKTKNLLVSQEIKKLKTIVTYLKRVMERGELQALLVFQES